MKRSTVHNHSIGAVAAREGGAFARWNDNSAQLPLEEPAAIPRTRHTHTTSKHTQNKHTQAQAHNNTTSNRHTPQVPTQANTTKNNYLPPSFLATLPDPDARDSMVSTGPGRASPSPPPPPPIAPGATPNTFRMVTTPAEVCSTTTPSAWVRLRLTTPGPGSRAGHAVVFGVVCVVVFQKK